MADGSPDRPDAGRLPADARPEAIEGETFEAETTVHVRRARDGDDEALAWVVRRFSPVLLAQARYRIGPQLAAVADPEDLVNDVWVVALGRLREIPSRGGRFTPVLMRFLSTTLLHRLQALLRKHIRGKPARVVAEADGTGRDPDPLAGIAALTRGVVTRVVEHEHEAAVSEALEALGDADREIIVLRGIEQNASQAVAAQLGIEETAARVRYHRALKRLRAALPKSIFSEFPEE
jgi:RNA polymerase sigma-70 factor (ECF subfamily)